MKTEHRALLIAILCGGLVAGSIDIGAAALINWFSPVTILHAIASGLLGKASFSAGATAVILGLILQWGMSLIIALIFVVAANKFPALARRWITSGTSYGVMTFLVMNYVVVPLSAAPWNPWKQPFGAEKFIENLLAMILFGLIVAFCAHHFAFRALAGNRENPPASSA